MVKAKEATEGDIEVVIKEKIKHQTNKVEIMVQNNSKEKKIMKIKDNLNRIMGINGIQVKWSVMSVLEQITIQEVVLTGEEAVTQTVKGLVTGVDTRPRKQYMHQTNQRKENRRSSCKEVNLNIKGISQVQMLNLVTMLVNEVLLVHLTLKLMDRLFLIH